MIYGSLLQCHFLTGQTGFLRGNTHCVALHRNIDGCSRLCVTAHIAMGIMGGMHRLNVVDALEVAQGTVLCVNWHKNNRDPLCENSDPLLV